MNKENLACLADYLEKLPKDYAHFEMSDYVKFDNVESERTYAEENGGLEQYDCGTVACAIGHGPSAGFLVPRSLITSGLRYIAGKYREVEVPDWGTYCANTFVDYEEETHIFEWMFGGSWKHVDNTHRGAAARIRYVLAGREVREDFDSEDANEFYVDKYVEFLV